MEKMGVCPKTGLLIPSNLIDQKFALKKFIDDWLERTVLANQHIKVPYFITFHAKFDPLNPEEFHVNQPKITKILPPFMSNTMVFWVDNKRSICEMLWMVPPKKKGEKPKIEFNTKGVAYLQAKGALTQ